MSFHIPDVSLIRFVVYAPQEDGVGDLLLGAIALKLSAASACLDRLIMPPSSGERFKDSWTHSGFAVDVMTDEEWSRVKQRYINSHEYLPGSATSFVIGCGLKQLDGFSSRCYVYVIGAY